VEKGKRNISGLEQAFGKTQNARVTCKQNFHIKWGFLFNMSAKNVTK